jgi:hypothetical protein
LVRDVYVLLSFCSVIYLQAYVELLKEILSDHFSVTSFFEKAGFTFSQKKQAVEILYKALETIASKDDEQAATAQVILAHFNVFINSSNARKFWSDLQLQEEKIKTQTLQDILQEKEVSILHL